jgi:hypothetical protein
MTIKNIKYTSLILILLMDRSQAVLGPDDLLADYSKIFTRSIYDQSDLNFDELSDVDKEEKPLEHLKMKKEDEIKLRCFNRLDDILTEKKVKLETIQHALDEIIEDGKEHQAKGSLAKTAVNVLGTLAGAGLAFWSGGLTLAAGGLNLAVAGGSLTGGLISQITGGGIESLKHEETKRLGKKGAKTQLDIQEYQAVKQEINEITLFQTILLEGVDKEPASLLEMEKEYILRKRFFPKGLQANLEEALIEARRTVFSNLEKSEPFIKRALLLPFTDNSLKDLGFYDIPTSIEHLVRFKKSQFFQGFSPTLQTQLKNVMSDIRRLSCPQTIESRRSYYFWGKPGVGKSTTAEEIAKFLGLPFFEVSIRTEADLSQQSIEGSERMWKNPQIGMFAQVLSSKSDEGITYQHPILILNDFDRVLKSPSSLSFLLFYLDPKNKHFLSNYFGCNLDISRLTIILTGNKKIPETEEYAALRDRLIEIEFDSPDPKLLTSILTDYKKDILKQYQPFFEKNRWWPRMKQKAVSHIPGLIQGETSIRTAKRNLEDLIGLQFSELYDREASRGTTKRQRKRQR